jgi:hypothetical protein
MQPEKLEHRKFLSAIRQNPAAWAAYQKLKSSTEKEEFKRHLMKQLLPFGPAHAAHAAAEEAQATQEPVAEAPIDVAEAPVDVSEQAPAPETRDPITEASLESETRTPPPPSTSTREDAHPRLEWPAPGGMQYVRSISWRLEKWYEEQRQPVRPTIGELFDAYSDTDDNNTADDATGEPPLARQRTN